MVCNEDLAVLQYRCFVNRVPRNRRLDNYIPTPGFSRDGSFWQRTLALVLFLARPFLLINCVIIVCICAIESLSSRGFTRGRDRYMCLSLPSRRWSTFTDAHVEGKSSSTQVRPYISFFPPFFFPLGFLSFFILHSDSLFS